MVDTLGFTNAVAGSPAYSGRMLRQSGSAAFGGATSARPLGARSGVRPGTSVTTVTATSATWSCGAFAGVADVEAAAEAGPYTFAFDAATSGAVTAADASSPRVDIVYVQVDDPSESDGSTVPAATRLYLAGVAAASPVAPATPARSFVVARVNVPALGGGSPTVSWVAPYAVAAGGIVPVASSAEYPASPAKGQYVDDAALGGMLRFNGTVWVPVSTDTGWLNITVAAGFVANGTPRVRRIGNRITVKDGFGNTGMVAGGTYTVGTMPVVAAPMSVRPIASHYSSAMSSTPDNEARVEFKTDGSIVLVIPSTLGTYFRLDNNSYLAD